MGLIEMSDIVERLERRAHDYRARHMGLAADEISEAASRIRELEGEVEKAEMALELLRKMRHGAARARDAALADNERLREALKHLKDCAVSESGMMPM